MAIDNTEDAGLLAPIDEMMHPYRGRFSTTAKLPAQGRTQANVLAEIESLRALEEDRWRDGFASGSVYHGDARHIEFVNKVYALQSQSNPLHADVWPSAAKFEAEIVAMTAHMLGAESAGVPIGSPSGICGSVTSGGSESILLAIKTYRDWAAATKKITRPQIVVPVSAHAAFHKAGQYFGIEVRTIPLDAEFRADVSAAEAAIGEDTIALVASAVNFPYGTIDPIDELSELARQRALGLHVDACLGGFFLPWAERLGCAVPPFDFRVPGVTSISCDTHKYGYAPKGTSVVLYRTAELRRYQYFTIADWPGGLYYSPTFAGSRPGGLSAACWAAMISIGEAGYLSATRQILDAVAVMRRGIDRIGELRVFGRPIGPFAVASDTLDMYQVLDQMSRRRWMLTGLQHPAALHVSPTLRHAQPGVAERFVADLAESVAYVRDTPNIEGGMAPIYGLAASIPDRQIVHDMLKQVMDVYYRL